MLIIAGEHVSSSVFEGHPLLGNRLVYLLCSRDMAKGSMLQVLQHVTKSSLGCRLSAPFCLTLLHPCKQFGNQHQLWIHSIWWAVITAPGTVAGLIATPTHSSVKQFHYQNSELMKWGGRDTWAKAKKEMGAGETSPIFFLFSKFQEHDWVICNKYCLTQIGPQLIGASLLHSVSDSSVLRISRLFQSLAVKARDQAVNLAPSQWDLTLVSHQGL